MTPIESKRIKALIEQAYIAVAKWPAWKKKNVSTIFVTKLMQKTREHE